MDKKLGRFRCNDRGMVRLDEANQHTLMEREMIPLRESEEPVVSAVAGEEQQRRAMADFIAASRLKYDRTARAAHDQAAAKDKGLSPIKRFAAASRARYGGL